MVKLAELETKGERGVFSVDRDDRFQVGAKLAKYRNRLLKRRIDMVLYFINNTLQVVRHFLIDACENVGVP